MKYTALVKAIHTASAQFQGRAVMAVNQSPHSIRQTLSADKHGHYSKREETDRAWRVSIDQIKAGNFNLDLKNPHNSDEGPGDVDHLLPEYEKLLAQIAETRATLKKELQQALTR